MRLHGSSLVLILSIIVSALSITASSQPKKDLLFRVSVPFDFIVGVAHLPAGRYSVYRVGASNIILIESVAGKGAAFTLVNTETSGTGERPNSLVFNRYGDRYFLQQVTTKFNNEIHICFRSPEEAIVIAEREKSRKEAASGY